MPRLTLTCALMAATALSAGSSHAQGLSIEQLATQAVGGEPELVPMSESELADERGGFLTPLGEINFAATLTTIINGQMALQTTLTLTEAGLTQQQVAGPAQTGSQLAANLGQSITQSVNQTVNQALAQAGLPAQTAAGQGAQATSQVPAIPVLPSIPAIVAGAGAADANPTAALTGVADALAPAVTALNQATGGLVSGLDNGNPTLMNQTSLQQTGGVESIAGALPGGVPTQAVGDLAGSLDSLIDAVTAYVPAVQAGAQTSAANQTQVYTPQVLPQSSQELKAAALAGGIDLGGLQGNGVVVPGEGGATAVLHNMTTNAMSNMVINTAANVDVALHTEISLTMPGLSQLQEDIAADSLTSSLHDAIGRALSGF